MSQVKDLMYAECTHKHKLWNEIWKVELEFLFSHGLIARPRREPSARVINDQCVFP